MNLFLLLLTLYLFTYNCLTTLSMQVQVEKSEISPIPKILLCNRKSVSCEISKYLIIQEEKSAKQLLRCICEISSALVVQHLELTQNHRD